MLHLWVCRSYYLIALTESDRKRRANSNRMISNQDFEVIIIGGSYSGLSAGMALGRSLRRVLIIDSGKPCNRWTPHAHNLITHDGNTPQEIVTLAKQQVARYETVRFHILFSKRRWPTFLLVGIVLVLFGRCRTPLLREMLLARWWIMGWRSKRFKLEP